MFEVGVARTFHALHQLEGGDAAASHQHGHEYRAEVVARGQKLDADGMLVDIDLLGAALSACLAELDSVDLGSLAAFAGRNTTVEMVAEHIWTHVGDRLAPAPALAGLRVTVYESADAWAAIDRAPPVAPPTPHG